jgi:hypothetical protein
MSKLAFHPAVAAVPTHPKILIYGAPGTGKTWFATAFPSVAYIDAEGGADLAHYASRITAGGGQYIGPADGARNPDFVLEQIEALATQPHNFKSLVIDSVTELFTDKTSREMDRLAPIYGDKSTYGKENVPAVRWMKSLLRALNKLDMNVVLIAHEKQTFVDDKPGPIEADVWKKLPHVLHLAMRATLRGPARNFIVTKSRMLGFPQATSIAVDFLEFKRRFEQDFGAGVIDAVAKNFALATPEQVQELRRLAGVLKLKPEQIEKSLSKKGADEWRDLTTEQAAEIIATLTASAAPTLAKQAAEAPDFSPVEPKATA